MFWNCRSFSPTYTAREKDSNFKTSMHFTETNPFLHCLSSKKCCYSRKFVYISFYYTTKNLIKQINEKKNQWWGRVKIWCTKSLCCHKIGVQVKTFLSSVCSRAKKIKNALILSKIKLVLKLPRFFTQRIDEWKSAAMTKQNEVVLVVCLLYIYQYSI